LDGTISLVSIIIGFMGAIMPIILSMKNESKFVRYVFERDTEELFKKYLKITIKVGLTNAGLTLVMFLHESFVNQFARLFIFYSWFITIMLFILLTMRSMSYMITIFFDKDDISTCIDDVSDNYAYSEEKREKAINKFTKK
jgi:Na+-driven multidrug efflux pump